MKREGFDSVYRDVRAFVERREFPVVSVHGQYGAGNPGMLTAQLVVDEDPHFEDRTYVEFEFLDSGMPDVVEDRDGVLLFEGEIRSYVCVTTPHGMQCIVTCAGTIVGHQTAATLTAANSKAKDMPLGVTSRFTGAEVLKDVKELQRILLTPLEQNAAPGVPGGLIHLLRRGLHVDDKDDSFLKAANERLNLDRCLGAAPNDDTTEIFLLMKETGKLLEDILNGAASAGGIPNVEIIKQLLLQRVFYQNVYVPPGYISTPTKVQYRTYTQTKAFAGFKKLLKDKIDLCARIVDVSGSWGTPYVPGAPEQGLLHTPSVLIQKVWVDIESHLDDINFGKLEGDARSKWSNVEAHINAGRAYLKRLGGQAAWNWLSETAETAVNAVKGLIGHDEKNAYGTLMEASKEALELYSEAEKGKKLTSAAIHLAEGAGLALTKLGQEMEETATVINTRKQQVKLYADELIAAFEDLTGAEQSWAKTHSEGTAPRRYHGEILIPELFFAVPPACNAIMPSMYTQVNIQHNMANVPTRLLLVCPSRSGAGRFFRKHRTSYVVAPNIKAINGGGGKPLILEDALMGKSVMLEHELFSGPNPLIMPISNALGYAVNDISELTKVGKKLRRKKGKLDTDLDFVQEIAHYRFFEQQIAYNQGSVTCHEWAHLIPGLPAAVLVGADNEAKNAYTAKIQQIQFSISKDRSSQAVVTLSHIMGLDERVNYMIHRRYYTTATPPTNHIKDLLVAAGEEQNKRTAAMLYTSAVIEAQKVTAKKGLKGTSDMEAATKQLGNHTVTEGAKASGQSIASIQQVVDVHAHNQDVCEGVVQGEGIKPVDYTAPTYDADPVTGAPNQPKPLVAAAEDLFNSLRDITGPMKITEGEPVSAEYDKLMHPSWLADCFNPENIGRVYEHLFGVKSMYDHVEGGGSVADVVGRFLGAHAGMGIYVSRPIVKLRTFQQEFRPEVSVIFNEAGAVTPPGEFTAQVVASPEEEGGRRGAVDPRPERGRIVDAALVRTRETQFTELVQDANEVELSKGAG